MYTNNSDLEKVSPKKMFKTSKKAVRMDQMTNKQVMEVLNNSESKDFEIDEAMKIASRRNLISII